MSLLFNNAVDNDSTVLSSPCAGTAGHDCQLGLTVLIKAFVAQCLKTSVRWPRSAFFPWDASAFHTPSWHLQQTTSPMHV